MQAAWWGATRNAGNIRWSEHVLGRSMSFMKLESLAYLRRKLREQNLSEVPRAETIRVSVRAEFLSQTRAETLRVKAEFLSQRLRLSPNSVCLPPLCS